MKTRKLAPAGESGSRPGAAATPSPAASRATPSWISVKKSNRDRFAVHQQLEVRGLEAVDADAVPVRYNDLDVDDADLDDLGKERRRIFLLSLYCGASQR